MSPQTRDPAASYIIGKVKQLRPSAKNALKSIVTGGISFGAIGKESHETLARTLNLIAMGVHDVDSMEELIALGGEGFPFSNSGEGGELSKRNGTTSQSRTRQVASGRFGVTLEYLNGAVNIQIKLAQGAKPGKGGQLPGSKVTEEIAEARMTSKGIDLVSPPPHHDIYSVEDLTQLIDDLRAANPNAKISVKLAATPDIGPIAVAVAKCGADDISIAGPGGTGAVTKDVKFNTQWPWVDPLVIAHNALTENGLRDKVTLTVSGGLQTGKQLAVAILLGADKVELGTLPLVAEGCIMARECHTGGCPAGIATTDKNNEAKNFRGTPEHVANIIMDLAESLAETLEGHGFEDPKEAVGRRDLLEVDENSPLKGLEELLKIPVNPHEGMFPDIPREDPISATEKEVITRIFEGNETNITIQHAQNDIKSFGARIGHHSLQTPFVEPTTVTFEEGAMGQSFGAFAPEGITLIAPYSNHGTGKGNSGSTIVVKKSTGDGTGYGATSGKIFAQQTGNRTAIRLSGNNEKEAQIIVGKTGDCAAEFMTGGKFFIVGTPNDYPEDYPIAIQYGTKGPSILTSAKSVGKNFGAGFTGGEIYLPKKLYLELERDGDLSEDLKEVKPQELDELDIVLLKERLQEYSDRIDDDQIWVRDLIFQEKFNKQFVKLKPSPGAKAKKRKAPEPATEKPTKRILPLNTPLVPPPVFAKAAIARSQIPFQLADNDACGVATLVDIRGKARESTLEMRDKVLGMLKNLKHRGASGIDPKTGDGCGVNVWGLDKFFQKKFPHLNLKKGEYGIIAMSLGDLTPDEARNKLQDILKTLGLEIAGDRDVETNKGVLGLIGEKQESPLKQFVVKKPDNISQEDFEKDLIRARLRFEMAAQKHPGEKRPHIFSASSYNVIYKSLAREDEIAKYFKDFNDPDFEISGGVVHARFATNTLPQVKNIQPLPKFSNNGENNGLQRIARLLKHDPHFKEALGIEEIDLTGFSDSHIMSILMDCLELQGVSAEDIVLSTIQRYDPKDPTTNPFYNLFGIPFEGPNASFLTIGPYLIMLRDLNGFRPNVGMQDDETFYAGSEWGPVEMFGKTFHLEPGKPIVIDLRTGEVAELLTKKATASAKGRIESIPKLTDLETKKNELQFSPEEKAIRRLRAGWNKEIEKEFLQPLFTTGKALASMADAGPREPFVKGSYMEFSNFFKNKFSQVTNPSLDPLKEKPYQTTHTFVGKRPSIANLHNDTVEGVFLATPVISNDELAALQNHFAAKSIVIDITYSVESGKDGLLAAIERIKAECLQAVSQGISFITLSDMYTNDELAAIPAVLIASAVNQALLEAGWRGYASIALQAGSLLTVRDVAQAISIGGVDVVNPYLPFMRNEDESEADFQNRCANYKENLTDGVKGFMAQKGISSVTAYRDSHEFHAEGLDDDIAHLCGVTSTGKGFGIQKLANVVAHIHRRPREEGTGRYDGTPSSDRHDDWGDGIASQLVNVARREPGAPTFAEVEDKVNGSTQSAVGNFKLKSPTHWTRKNPMKVCILGGGASAFYQARELLDSGLPVEVIIIEKNRGNKFGLLGDGVAPDHTSTKEQAEFLREILNDPRVKYYGGIKVVEQENDINDRSAQVSLESLKEMYPCIIDCRGAPKDIKLNKKGEDLPSVMPASAVYKAYNGVFRGDVETEGEEAANKDWPFNSKSKNKNLCVIGSGNAAADIIRVCLKNPDELEQTRINPGFLQKLHENEGPDSIHVFARCNPHGTKITIGELGELAHLEGVDIYCNFDDSEININNLSTKEQALYKFFAQYKDRKYPHSKNKQFHFHFQAIPKEFEKNEEDVTAIFTKSNGEEVRCTAKNVVVAIGTQAVPTETSNQDGKAIYKSGWVTGQGGTIGAARESVQQTTQQIKQDFKDKKFVKPKPPEPKKAVKEKGVVKRVIPWQARCTVKNAQYDSILAWLNDGNMLITEADFEKALAYQRAQKANAGTDAPLPIAEPGPDVDLNKLRMSNGKGRVDIIDLTTLPDDMTILEVLQADKPDSTIPKAPCGGKGSCGECVCDIEEISSLKALQLTPREKPFVRSSGKTGPSSFLSCQHTVGDIKGTGLRGKIKKPVKVDKSLYVDLPRNPFDKAPPPEYDGNKIGFDG